LYHVVCVATAQVFKAVMHSHPDIMCLIIVAFWRAYWPNCSNADQKKVSFRFYWGISHAQL